MARKSTAKQGIVPNDGRTGRTRGLARSVAVFGLAAAGWLAITGGAPASAGTPADTGCPTSYDLLNVADLTAQGYQLPAQLDDPANGGNGDGWVCGKPANDHKAENFCNGPCPVPQLYDLVDNNRTPAH